MTVIFSTDASGAPGTVFDERDLGHELGAFAAGAREARVLPGGRDFQHDRVVPEREEVQAAAGA